MRAEVDQLDDAGPVPVARLGVARVVGRHLGDEDAVEVVAGEIGRGGQLDDLGAERLARAAGAVEPVEDVRIDVDVAGPVGERDAQARRAAGAGAGASAAARPSRPAAA